MMGGSSRELGTLVEMDQAGGHARLGLPFVLEEPAYPSGTGLSCRHLTPYRPLLLGQHGSCCACVAEGSPTSCGQCRHVSQGAAT